MVLWFRPVLASVPMPVLTGLFLYLGQSALGGNQMYERGVQLISDPSQDKVSWAKVQARARGRERASNANTKTITNTITNNTNTITKQHQHQQHQQHRQPSTWTKSNVPRKVVAAFTIVQYAVLGGMIWFKGCPIGVLFPVIITTPPFEYLHLRPRAPFARVFVQTPVPSSTLPCPCPCPRPRPRPPPR